MLAYSAEAAVSAAKAGSTAKHLRRVTQRQILRFAQNDNETTIPDVSRHPHEHE
jgi:hypothetical protein